MIFYEPKGSPGGWLAAGLLFLGLAVKGIITGTSWGPNGRVYERRTDPKQYRESIGMGILVGVGFILLYLYKTL